MCCLCSFLDTVVLEAYFRAMSLGLPHSFLICPQLEATVPIYLRLQLLMSCMNYFLNCTHLYFFPDTMYVGNIVLPDVNISDQNDAQLSAGVCTVKTHVLYYFEE